MLYCCLKVVLKQEVSSSLILADVSALFQGILSVVIQFL